MKKFLLSALLISTGSALLIAAVLTRAPQQPTNTSAIVDPNFNAPIFTRMQIAIRAVFLPDGKYFVFWGTDTLTDQNTAALVRFNSDGSVDNSFSFSRNYPDVRAVVPTAESKLIVAARHPVPYGVEYAHNHAVYDILRVNPDGSIDQTFGPAQTTDGDAPRAIGIAPDGKVLVAGVFTGFNGQPRQGLVRLLANGTVDPAFAPITLTGPQNPVLGRDIFGLWAAPVVDVDGKTLISGDFVGVNGVSRLGVARLNSDGSLDTSFVPSGFAPLATPSDTQPRAIRGLGRQSDGKVIIGGRFVVGSVNRVPVLRLNADGSRDTSYNHYTATLPGGGGFGGIKDLVVAPDDKVVAVDFAVWRFNTDGSLDPTFHNSNFLYTHDCCGAGYNIGRQADGSFFVGGFFTDVDDEAGPYVERWGAVRLNPDGTVRPDFATSHRTGLKIEPSSFLRTNDGATLIAFNAEGDFQDPVSHNFGRVLSNGSVDPNFDPVASFDPNGPLGPDLVANGFTPLTDGSLLIHGDYGYYASYGRLLPPSWTEDPDYQADDADFTSFDAAWPRGDGKVIVNTSWYAQRINANGSPDDSFVLDPSIGDAQFGQCSYTGVWFGGGVLALTANNTLLVGYPTRDGVAHLVRLNNDGSIDPTFPERTAAGLTFDYTFQYVGCGFPQIIEENRKYSSIDFPFKQAKTVAGDKILLVGSFASYGGTPAHGIVRLNNDGSIDSAFNVGGGAQWTQTQETATFHPGVDNVEIFPNGQLLLSGTFEAFNGVAAPGIVLLNADGSVDTSFVPPVARQKYDYQPAYLKAQPDGSFLLSGPYAKTGQTASPSFLRLLLSPVATSVVSRKTHGAAGAFDVNLPMSGTPGVESRSGGATNDHQLVVTFSSDISVTGNPQAQVTSGLGDIGGGGVNNGGAVTVSGNTVTVPLTNIANAQTISVTLFGVTNTAGSGNTVVQMSVLAGDANGNGTVNASDVAFAKSRISQPIDATNFRADVNANGTINASDVSFVKSRVSTGLP